MRWLLLKDLQILRRSPLVTGLLVVYPVLIAVLIGVALSAGPDEPRIAFLNEIPEEEQVDFGEGGEFDTLDAKRELCERVEWHYTPRHGSWLNVAELELSVLARQCLGRRIPDMAALRREVAAWERERNAAVVRVDWQFATADARTKLKRLYPSLELQ